LRGVAGDSDCEDDLELVLLSEIQSLDILYVKKAVRKGNAWGRLR